MTAISEATDLAGLARTAALELEEATAQEIVAWATSTFGARFCITSSMTDAVLVDLVSRTAPGTDVLFLDTGTTSWRPSAPATTPPPPTP
jgi:phosphoadenosine phosphosulfate reductase